MKLSPKGIDAVMRMTLSFAEELFSSFFAFKWQQGLKFPYAHTSLER
jgi:hypothetical protein